MELTPKVHLSEAEARVLRALVRERDAAGEAVAAYVRFLGAGMVQPEVHQTAEGLVLVDAAEGDAGDEV